MRSSSSACGWRASASSRSSTPFDLVVLLTLSNTVQNAIIGDDNSVTGGLIGAATLLVINHVVVRFLYGHERLDRLVEGDPDVLIENGVAAERSPAEGADHAGRARSRGAQAGIRVAGRRGPGRPRAGRRHHVPRRRSRRPTSSGTTNCSDASIGSRRSWRRSGHDPAQGRDRRGARRWPRGALAVGRRRGRARATSASRRASIRPARSTRSPTSTACASATRPSSKATRSAPA